MAGAKEIRTHIKSVEQTLKITNAMYLISSSNLRRARRRLEGVEPYFRRITATISDILRHSPQLDSPYFGAGAPPRAGKSGYIIITGDKGLAGAYHQNLFKGVQPHLDKARAPKLLLIGKVGRTWFSGKGAAVDESFLYSAQHPTPFQAEKIGGRIVAQFQQGALDEVYVVYTEMVSALQLEPRVYRLLPLSRDWFPQRFPDDRVQDGGFRRTVRYAPSPDEVMRHIVPSFVKGVIFGALVESYCSEQAGRMTAMDAATKNGRELLGLLSQSYNRARQAAITQQLSEITGGAQAEE